MEKKLKALDEKIKKLESDNAEFKIMITKLEEKVLKLESGEKNTGIYLDGAPEYVKEYVIEEKGK